MADIIIYNTADGKAAIKLYADNGTVWLTQAQIAELFTKNISTISRHIANIFDENEIEEKSNLRFMQIANSENLVVSESREAMDAEVEAMYRHSKEIVESEPYHKKVMEECAKMRAVLNPQIAKDRQQEEDINNLKSEVSGMKGTLTDIKSMLSVALEKVNTKK